VPSQEDFDKAAAEAKELPSGTSNDDQLILYGLFKQANIGDCNTSE
jgi:diazepam-binding inhibitor (GABA receptor modulator, acyl-CoA-binding protein)